METINIRYLIELAEEFGLPCIEQDEVLTVVGEKQLLVFNIITHFNILEETQCQLIEIY